MRAMVEGLETRRLMAFADLVAGYGDNGRSVKDASLPLAEQADGKVLATDRTATGFASGLVRLTAGGQLDATFSGDGRVSWPSRIVAARQLADGKIVFAYNYERTIDPDWGGSDVFGLGVARLNADGSLDTAFGKKGSDAAAFREQRVGRSIRVADVQIDADGTTYFAASSDDTYISDNETPFTSFVLKFSTAGRVDTAFGGDGVVTLDSRQRDKGRNNFVRTLDSIAIRDGGSILIGGTALTYNESVNPTLPQYDAVTVTRSSAYVTRLRADGTIDTRFGVDGTFAAAKAVPDDQNFVNDGTSASVFRQDDGRLLLAYRAFGRPQVAVISATGRLLTAQSRPQTQTPSTSGDFEGVARLPNGDLVIAGFSKLHALRRTPTGYVTGGPTSVADADGKALPQLYLYAEGLLPLRDGTLLIGNGDGGLLKLRTDDAAPRGDDLPFAQQNSITTTNFSNGPDPLDAFFHDARGGLKYRNRDEAGRWGAIETVDAANEAGLYLSSSGRAVAYTDGDSGDLKFARRAANGTWRIETVDAAGATGYFPSLLRTGDIANETYAVAYYDRTRGDLKVARRSAGGQWTIRTVDSRGDVGRLARLALRQNGGLSVAYATGGTEGVQLAEEDPDTGTWAFTDVATTAGGVGGLDLSVATTNLGENDRDPSETVTAIAFYDAGPADFALAYKPTQTSKFTLLRERAGGAAGLDPHVTAGERISATFYDRTRDQIRGLTVATNARDGRAVLRPDGLPRVDGAGPFSGPVVEVEPPGLYSGVYVRRNTNVLAWYDRPAAVLRVRDPVF